MENIPAWGENPSKLPLFPEKPGARWEAQHIPTTQGWDPAQKGAVPWIFPWISAQGQGSGRGQAMDVSK